MWMESPLPQSLPSRNLPPKVLPVIKPVQTLPLQSILHTAFHVIHTLVGGPEENLSNLAKVSQLSYDRTNYRNFIDIIVRTIRDVLKLQGSKDNSVHTRHRHCVGCFTYTNSSA